MTVKILHSADIHIKLKKNKVNPEWQLNRFKLFFSKILELELAHDITVLAGDIFDEAPSLEETTLLIEYLNKVKKPTIIIPGNHEASVKGGTFLESFVRDKAITNELVKFYTKNDRFLFMGYWFQVFPYTEVQKNNLINYAEKDILITHMRGEVPPHITPEYDFEKLREFKLVLCGDLHFYHKYKDYNLYYPGSPLNTSFDRTTDKKYGVISHTFWREGHTHTFIDLHLPKLIRKSVRVNDDLAKDTKDWVIYEVKGKPEEIQQIKQIQPELLDKAIIEIPNTNSKLLLKDMNLYQEVDAYLKYINIDNTQEYIQLLVEYNIT